jgi:hypothetical protein
MFIVVFYWDFPLGRAMVQVLERRLADYISKIMAKKNLDNIGRLRLVKYV